MTCVMLVDVTRTSRGLVLCEMLCAADAPLQRITHQVQGTEDTVAEE